MTAGASSNSFVFIVVVVVSVDVGGVVVVVMFGCIFMEPSILVGVISCNRATDTTIHPMGLPIVIVSHVVCLHILLQQKHCVLLFVVCAFAELDT